MCISAPGAGRLRYSAATGASAESPIRVQKPEASLGLMEGHVPWIDYSKLVLVPLP